MHAGPYLQIKKERSLRILRNRGKDNIKIDFEEG